MPLPYSILVELSQQLEERRTHNLPTSPQAIRATRKITMMPTTSSSLCSLDSAQENRLISSDGSTAGTLSSVRELSFSKVSGFIVLV